MSGMRSGVSVMERVREMSRTSVFSWTGMTQMSRSALWRSLYGVVDDVAEQTGSVGRRSQPLLNHIAEETR